MTGHQTDHHDQPEPDSSDSPVGADAQEQLQTTAEHWREAAHPDNPEPTAEEVAEGAERASRQPDYGREGN